jgi:hypothetical protein
MLLDVEAEAIVRRSDLDNPNCSPKGRKIRSKNRSHHQRVSIKTLDGDKFLLFLPFQRMRVDHTVVKYDANRDLNGQLLKLQATSSWHKV